MTAMRHNHHINTKLCHAGRSPQDHHGSVNPPVYHASTILFPDVATLQGRHSDSFTELYYGRHGNPTTFAFEKAVTTLEGGDKAIIVNSGLAAITTSLTTFLKAGDHMLMVDCVYSPARRFTKVLERFGVDVTFFDPLIGRGIEALIRPNTRVIYLESPGSITFEIQDVPAIVAAARAAEKQRDNGQAIKVILDNTWSTPLYFKPFTFGVNVSIHSATKYMTGHSDTMLGVIVTDTECAIPIKANAISFGLCAGPDDVYRGLQGLRTLSVRLKQHQETALVLADWFAHRPEIERVLHPARPDHVSYHLWQRDFSGSSGLFSVLIKSSYSPTAVAAMVDGFELFGIGYSWGGFESLVLPFDPSLVRSATQWTGSRTLLRIYAGLEEVTDLIADLDQGFTRLNAAR